MLFHKYLLLLVTIVYLIGCAVSDSCQPIGLVEQTDIQYSSITFGVESCHILQGYDNGCDGNVKYTLKVNETVVFGGENGYDQVAGFDGVHLCFSISTYSSNYCTPPTEYTTRCNSGCITPNFDSEYSYIVPYKWMLDTYCAEGFKDTYNFSFESSSSIVQTNLFFVLVSLDKYKELISIGLKSIQSRTYSKYDKILFVGSLALPFLVNLPIYGIIPNQQDTRIESMYDNAIDRITNVYNEIQTDPESVYSLDIKNLASVADKSNKLCRILAQKDVVMTLLDIIINGEEIHTQRYNDQLPLSDKIIEELYLTIESNSIMLDCISLLNSILPFVQDIPYGGLIYIIINYPSSPTSYQLTCAVLKTMALRPEETIQPFLDVGLIHIIKYFLDKEVTSEHSVLRYYWLQVAQTIYKSPIGHFETTEEEQEFIDEYYENGRFKLWLPKQLRIKPFSVMFETLTDTFGFYKGWVTGTSLFVDLVYSSSPVFDAIYRRLDSTLTRYLACSLFFSTFALYSTVFLSRQGKIYYSLSSILTMSHSVYLNNQVNRQRLGGDIYKSFKKYYKTNDQNNSPFSTINNDQIIIKDKSDILDCEF
ncbi:hypothetical protein DFA_08029 [Cavenderia fasciculata]|uniref:Transmembrane protein n=1 Tax=Cavenderia fasciculata TaxID=261658 RepID=F4Q4N9_CACFS|nr:uncharacterized protein DFA_08029 [Cavenderia fasciculata]EGG17048.1 hypothetical protein DFA_08029 [Cavenderia fasciculata]|eukprot:XP_004355532.1 hypothetical protein DFA_08029 [Cavenderia fasciculata]